MARHLEYQRPVMCLSVCCNFIYSVGELEYVGITVERAIWPGCTPGSASGCMALDEVSGKKSLIN